MTKGLLIVYAGSSGVGKGTIMKKLLSSDDNFRLSISATTRLPREGEKDGREYYFVTNDEFDRLIREDGFLEHAEYVGNRYGTPKKPVEDMLDKGIDVFLEIELKGFLQVKESCKDFLSIFVIPPSKEILEERLKKRATESDEMIRLRLIAAEEELENEHLFDYVVVNDDVDRAANEILDIIRTEKAKRK